MIIQEHFLKKLRSSFDLNIYEVKIWTALLSRGIATAGELSDISNVPRSRSYDVLESLEKKGFVVTKIGKPIKYIAVKPEEILRRVKKAVKESANTKLKTLDQVKTEDVFQEIDSLYKQGIDHIDPTTLSGAIKSRTNVYNHLDAMLQNATKSVVLVTTPDGFLRKAKVLKNRFKKLQNKGIKIKIATQLTPEVKNVAKEMKLPVKAIPIKGRFCIVDGKEVMFMISDDKVHENYDSAIWVNTSFFAKSLEALFEVNWRK